MNPDAQQPTIMPQPQPTMQTAPPKKSRKGIVAMIVAIALLLVAGGGYAAYAYFMNQPENLMQSAFEDLSKKTAFAGDFTVVAGANPSITFKGGLAVTMDAVGKKNGEVIADVAVSGEQLQVRALAVDDTIYLKVLHAETLSSLLSNFFGITSEQAAKSLEKLNDQWFEIAKSDSEVLAQSSGSDTATGRASFDDTRKIFELYKQHPFLKASQIYADQAIAGNNSAHFDAIIDRAQYNAFLLAVKSAELTTVTVSDEDLTTAQSTDPLQDTKLELWISRNNRAFTQMRATSTKKDQETSITFTFANNLPSFDALQKPTGTKAYSEALTSLLGGLQPETQAALEP